MPVLTKINTNSIAEDAITGDKFAGDAYIANSTTQNISGTYSENRLYTSDAYTLSGNATVNSHITLSSVKPTADVVLTAGGAYTITGTGVLSGGSLLAKERTDLTGMTGELGSVVTGAPAITGLGTVTTGDISNLSASFQTYCAVPVGATTLGTAGGSSMTAINLLSQLSSVGQPKTAGFSVNVSDDTISIETAGTYYVSLMLYFAEDGISRDNYLVCAKAANAVPTPTVNKVMESVFVNPGTSNSGTTCYFTTFSAGIATFAVNDRIKFFGRGVYNTQAIAEDASLNRSSVTIIKIN